MLAGYREAAAKNYGNFDASTLFEPLISLKRLEFYGKLSSKLADIPNLNFNVTSECEEDLLIIGAAALDPNNTAPKLAQVLSQMMDATAKIPPGMLRGSHYLYGFKQECDVINYKLPNRNREFSTAYSRAFLSASGPCTGPEKAALGFDICMPSSCSSTDLENIVSIIPKINATFAPIADSVCSINTLADINKSMTTGSWIMVAFLSILSALVILSGITDYCILPSNSPLRKQFEIELFLSFSGYKSVCEILSATKFKKGQIGPINCLRVMSMFWVIFGHVCLSAMSYSDNILDFMSVLDYFLTQIIENALFSVDTFFFIGGVLLAFMWFKGYEKDRRKLMSPQGWIMFYVHRIIRLSAPYWVALLTYTYLFNPLLTQDMLFFTPITPKYNPCTKFMWKNMLYIFNFNISEICLGQAWYLATDMQMYVATPIILIPLALYPIIGWIVAITLLILSTAANVFTVYHYNFPPTGTLFGPDAISSDPVRQANYFKLVYYAPWIRCQIYIMGLLVGWCLQKYKDVRINKILNLILWGLGASLMLTALFGLYHYNQGNPLSLFWRAAYSSLSRPAWGLGLTWLTVSCYYGYGGPINQFMSWNIWVPLGRLSYCAYLVHYPLIDYVYGLEKNAIYYSSLWQIIMNYFIPTVTITFALALVLSVLVEVPAGKLETLLLRPRPREKHLKADGPSWEITNGKTNIEEIIIIEKNDDVKF
uniref:Nose resistant-to-fluoxetine protein N-terminal domain-containing protein n=1 Tax=Panagrolaimus superbus TaxID=310955 RepID=A0A914YCN9_9BILA